MIILVKIGIAYYNQGFINIRVFYQEYFPQHGGHITVYLDSWDNLPITLPQGNPITINRNANPNNTPRIYMGGNYRAWVQRNFQQIDTMIVEILNPDRPNSILLRTPGVPN
jgi:hypothetical protein